MSVRGSRGEKSDKEKNFAKALRRLAEMGSTQSWLARKLGVLPKRITGWKNGIGEPTAWEWRQIALALDLSVDYLTDPTMDDPPPPPISPDEWQVIFVMRALELSGKEACKRLYVIRQGDVEPVKVRHHSSKPKPKKSRDRNAKR